MKKVAIFQVDLNIGGIQKSCVNLVNNIDTSKYEVDLYLISKENVFINDINKKINIKYLDPLPYITKLLPISLLSLFYSPKIDKKYDIVIDFNSYSNETAIAAIKTEASTKIMWVHNDVEIKIKEEILYRVLHIMFKSKYKYFNKFVGVSTGALDSFIRLNKVKDKETLVIPNFIDTKEIKEKIKAKSNIKIDENKINICSTGRIVHQKGFDILVNFINSIKDELTNHHFYIIGDGSEKTHIESLIKELKLENLVTLTGFLDNPYPLMNNMDAFILMSRYEGQGMVFLEAKSLGLDVIMPKALEKYVDKEIKGVEDIKSAILNLKKHPHKFDELENYNKKIKDKINNL
ncbi:MAG: glycosyltransferase [Bacilli bacterium]|nr:glycosyltransferase [Bacilli bacterium]